MILLANRRDDRPSLFGAIRLLAGPRRLPPARIESNLADERLLAAFFDKPLFPENFSSDEAPDVATRRTLDDWETFYQGAVRLVEYLKHTGYNGAVISVACEGRRPLSEPIARADDEVR